MSGKKAKQLRKYVYGDLSPKIKREYVKLWSGAVCNKPGSPRAVYQAIKKV